MPRKSAVSFMPSSNRQSTRAANPLDKLLAVKLAMEGPTMEASPPSMRRAPSQTVFQSGVQRSASMRQVQPE